jgi:exodeoxyribonuclease-1
MAEFSFFWHDYETFGLVPRRDRPAQFAGIRTDADLNEIDQPVVQHCRPATDYLPDPESCLLTGITPQHCLQHGVVERDFAAAIEHQLALPGTVGVGYNSIRFDDEVTRFLFWRNLIDPYAREWQNECGRWDILDVTRCCWALRPGGVEWPNNEDGTPSFKLEHLSAANGLTHDLAHDALSDVRATLALARLIRARQPKLWQFCLKLRRKEAVIAEMGVDRPFIHLSGRYPVERGCLAVVWPLAPHPTNRNELIVWDLMSDPSAMFDLNATTIRERLFTRSDDLPDGIDRLPIKTIHLNKCPIVIGNLNTLGPAAERWGIDLARVQRHAELARQRANSMFGIWPEVFERTEPEAAPDVDQDLYGGFLGNEDRRALARLRALPPRQLADKHPAFADDRLEELLFRFRARNHSDTLTQQEHSRWAEHRVRRLRGGTGGGLTLVTYFERIDVLMQTADEHGRRILRLLREYGQSIAPSPEAGV